ncbi:transporter substrate-binding domain-containing protein [Rhizobium sp. RAF56]|jgi:polar amino acid transport system substrate-binding protein|uniref:transporter substrate-binding domain-containing protein n=1 Tax=Rhizobium sp. RAF56 TaxID=3233062 RepID=UPI003F987B0B
MKSRILGGIAAGIFAIGAMLAANAASAAGADVPAPGVSSRIDAIKARGTLKVAVLGELPWLIENTSGSGEPFSGPSWLLATEYAKRLGVKLEPVPVSHETKVPILATGQVDITIAPLSITDARKKVVDFIVYSKSSLCMIGLKSNPKLANIKSVDDLNSPDITMAYYTGTPPETWVPTRFPKMAAHGVSGSGATAPVEEIVSKRADIAPLDNTKWPEVDKAVAGLMVFPADCLRSQEMATPVGHAIDKNQPEFLAWLQAVAAEVQPQVEAEEFRVIKGN